MPIIAALEAGLSAWLLIFILINVKQHFTISSSEVQDAAQQVLSMRLGEQYLAFAISNPHTASLIQLAWYDREDISAEKLQDVYEMHPELHHSFYKTIVCFDHSRSILIPPAISSHDHSKQLLETMYGANGRQTIITENINGWQMQNVYAVPADTQEWITRHFPAAEYWHNYSIGLRCINAADIEGSILIDFHANDFSVVASHASKLLLAQTFSYVSPADVVYNLIKVCKEFSLERETVKLSVSGLIEKDSALYRELMHYFVTIHFRQPGWEMPEGAGYPAHFFTSLNDLAVCAS